MDVTVYKITFSNNKVYIGITNRSLKDRMVEHKSRLKTGRKNKLYSAMKKYEDFQVDILEKCETYDMAKTLEIKYIKHFNSNGAGGYNMTDGGDGALGYRPSDQTRDRMSKAQKGKKRSPEHIKTISEAKKGFKFSEESKIKMSIWQKGKKKPKKVVDKLKKTVARPFNVYVKDTGGFVGHWENVTDCAKDLEVHKNSIHNFFAGLSKCVAKKYVFRRV